jgi:hypothetical protein
VLLSSEFCADGPVQQVNPDKQYYRLLAGDEEGQLRRLPASIPPSLPRIVRAVSSIEFAEPVI